jgi:hypothetical protein
MRTAWDVLTDAGVPDGAARRRPCEPLDAASIVAALDTVSEHIGLWEPHEKECLVAWLAAFRHHWPDRFAAILGAVGERVLERCTGGDLDPNRYLKLRRIATENLTQRMSAAARGANAL